MGRYIYEDARTTHNVRIVFGENDRLIIACTSRQQAEEQLAKAGEWAKELGKEIMDASIEDLTPEAEDDGKPFTHYRVTYKSRYGGYCLTFIAKDLDIDEELDKMEDYAGVMEIDKVTRRFSTRESRLKVRFDILRDRNKQNADTDARLSGLRIY